MRPMIKREAKRRPMVQPLMFHSPILARLEAWRARTAEIAYLHFKTEADSKFYEQLRLRYEGTEWSDEEKRTMLRGGQDALKLNTIGPADSKSKLPE